MENELLFADSQAVPKSRRLWSWWLHYVILLRSFLARAEVFFEKLGRTVAYNPKKTILVAVLVVALSTTGLLQLRNENRVSKLFVPEHSTAEKALIIGSSFFSNSINTRTEEIIIIPRNGSNVLSMVNLQEALRVIKAAENVTGYDMICKTRPAFLKTSSRLYKRDKICTQMNPLEILTGRERNMQIVFRKFKRAMISPHTLMSNGRAAIFNIKNGLPGFNLSEQQQRPFATALKIQLFLKQGQNDSERQNVLQWEKDFIRKMEDIKSDLKHVSLFFTADRSLDDALVESSSRDISLISITFSVMITFSCFMLAKFINPVRGHSWLAITGVLSTGLGILAGIAITTGVGIPFISLVGMVPFLVVSIGIDDMFIIVDEFDRQSKDHTPENRVAFALSKVGATITMTTVTDVIAFFVSSTSAFPAIRYFCIYTAVCINIEFLLQITLFIAFLTLDSRRIFSNRSDCCPALQVRDRTCCGLQNTFSLSTNIMRRYGQWLLSRIGKLVVVVSSFGLLAFGIYGCMHVENEFNRRSLAVKGSYYSDFIKTFESNFPQTIPVSIQITKKINYSDPFVREQISDLAKIAYNTSYYLSQNFTWVHYFDDFTRQFGIDDNSNNFKESVKFFLSMPAYSQHNVDIILDDKGEITASRVIVFLKDNAKSTFQKDAMIKLRQHLKLYSPIECTVAADPFIYFEQYAIVVKEIISNLLSVSTVITIVLIPFCIHPFIILFILIGFAMLILELFGLMYFWDVQLNAISMINIVMSVGFSVDYSAHIAHSFATSTAGSVNERIMDALSTVGGSVIMGGVSTFLGMSLTGFASSTIFQIFFKMFLGIIAFGLFNGLALLPVLLSIFSYFFDYSKKVTPEDITNAFSKKSKQESNNVNVDRQSRKGKFSAAITGMSTRFPTARDNQQFRKLLEAGCITASEYPEDRHARGKYFEGVFNPTRPVAGRAYVSDGSYLENIEKFDHQFFGISATEAKSMDPQQRMLLQGVYEAIEDAGMTLEELQQCCTGVYIGIMNLDYSSVVLKDDTLLSIDQFASTGTAFSIAANRISFSLNLTGPSVAIDTACSSSLTALSIACDQLQRRCVDVAIVAAANLVLCPRKQVTICRTNMLAPDGKCKVFDERADGYGRGEGIVAFVLKASDLVSPADRPYCEILGWGINNDGQTAAPITAPSVASQTDLMVNVLQQCCVNPQDVQYVEMHGTGTIIGDMVETKSVGEVYGKSRKAMDPIMIGSAKSNINHTESAAGLAGLAKVCLMMQSGKVYPTVGIENQAVRLEIEEKGLVVPTRLYDWPETGNGPKIAAINSFGYGGSNAHLIVRRPAKQEGKHKNDKKSKECKMKGSMRLFVLSARSQAALGDMATLFSTWMKSIEDNDQNLADVCYTLSERRSNHKARVAVAANSLTEASNILERFSSNLDEKNTAVFAGKTIRLSSSIAFVFGGQGSQWFGMAGDILANPKMHMEICKIAKRATKRGHKRSLLAFLKGEGDESEVEDCLVTVQLSIFALQYAVAKFIQTKASIIPIAVGGHSLGDITAACVAGIIKVKEAVKIIMARASLQDQCKAGGAMAAIGLPAKDVEAILEKVSVSSQICIAAENDKSSVTISGDADAIDKIENYILSEQKKIFWRRLATHKAFHSHHMNTIEEQFKSKIKDSHIKPKKSQTLFISTTEGKRVEASEVEDEFWWKNLRNPVLFNQCIQKMLSYGISVFIEISPRPVLTHYIKAIAKQVQADEITVLQALPKKNDESRLQHLFAQCVGQMYTLGYEVSFDLLQDQDQGQFIRCPLYPWQETDLWVKDEFCRQEESMRLIGIPDIVNAKQCTWLNEIDLYKFKYLNDHTMKTTGVILPGACYVEMALEAAFSSTKIAPIVIKDVMFQNILPLNEHLVRTIKCTRIRSTSEGTDDFDVMHLTEQGGVQLARAKLVHVYQKPDDTAMSIGEAMTGQRQILLEERQDLSSMITDSMKKINTDSESDSGVSETRSSEINETDTADSEERGSNLLQEDKVVMSKLNFGNDYKCLNATEFKDLALQTGFQFGERFSLIEHAWSSEKKALARLQIPDSLAVEILNYIVHPCIIDACLQTCIAIASNDSTRQVIPVGVKAVRMNPVRRRFHTLYGYAEIDNTAPDSCNVTLLDDNGQAILILQGFKVKELSRSQRHPIFEKSLYEMNWIPSSSEAKPDSVKEHHEFLILGFVDCTLVKRVIECLSDSGISNDRIHFKGVKGESIVSNFERDFQAYIDQLEDVNKKVMVINLLPSFANSISLSEELSLTAEWLCFESTLLMLKILTECKVSNSKIVSISYQSFAYEMHQKTQSSLPWGSTSLGLARVTNLETDIPVIPVDIQHNPSKQEIQRALSSLCFDSADEGLIQTPTATYQPILQRITPGKFEDQQFTFKSAKNFYLSWSSSAQMYCLKNNVPQDRKFSDDCVVVSIQHLSSATGSSKELLQNVTFADSKTLLQCAFGVVVEVNGQDGGFNVGDEVIAVFSSKWLKDRISLPTSNVFKKPSSLSPKEASIFPGPYALAEDTLMKILKTGDKIRSIFIAGGNSIRGLCWAIANVAASKGLEVTFDGHPTNPTSECVLHGISGEYMKGSQTYDKEFDCVICSSDQHPVDHAALLNATRKDGVMVILDAGFSSSTNHYNVSKSITVLNLKLFDVMLSSQVVQHAIDEFASKHLSAFVKPLPETQSVSVSELCCKSDVEKLFEGKYLFDCLDLQTNGDDILPFHPPSMDIQGLKEDRTYVVIGGTKGLGFNTVAWMASRGAGLVLPVGRSEPSQKVAADYKSLERKYDMRIKFVQADVSTKKGINTLRRELEHCPKLAGVVNSAAVIDDRLFKDVDRDSYHKVMQPKINGTLHLHEMLEDGGEEIDFMILYSSITAVLGNSGQSSYAAANAFMNSFADYRAQVLGKPCLAVCWGAMGGGGILDRNIKVAMLLEKSGLHLLDIPTGLSWMDRVLTMMPQKSNLCICDIEWRQFLDSIPSKKANSIIYNDIRKEIPEKEESNGNILEMILNEKSPEKQMVILLNYIKGWIAAWISGSAEEVDCNVPLFTYGIDSVGATAMKGQMEKDLQIEFEVFYFMQPETTINKLAEDLLKAIHEKFIKKTADDSEEQPEEECDEEEKLLKEEDEDKDKLVLPKEYLTVIYKPDYAQANFFIVHPSHRYSGVFQVLGMGMKYQRTFSLYAFGWMEPSVIGEDIGSVRRLAKACIELMLEVQPEGPYFLGGYSFGGLVSLEMASLLKKAGKEVALLVMIDTIRWIPAGRNNAKLLIDMGSTDMETEVHIKEQMKSFFCKVATRKLRMSLEEYQRIQSEHSFQETKEILINKAKELEIDIPDIDKILESTTLDQQIAARCHNEWVPANLYDGDILYLQAEQDHYCRRVIGVGTSAECWASVLFQKPTLITCPGDHYSMMDASRGPGIGKILSVAAMLKLRRIFPSRINKPQSGCQKQSILEFKQNGLEVIFIHNRVGIEAAVRGNLKLSKSQKRLTFRFGSMKASKEKIRLNDVINITKLETHVLLKTDRRIRNIHQQDMFAGLCFITKHKSKLKFMCINGQDYRRLVYLLEAVYCVKLPF